MKKKKGQALVEFVIILPVFLLLVFSVIDFGRIIFTLNGLESINNDIIEIYRNNGSYDEMLSFAKKKHKDISLEIINRDNKYVEFILVRELKLITPGLGLAIGNPYKAKTSRVIYYEQ